MRNFPPMINTRFIKPLLFAILLFACSVANSQDRETFHVVVSDAPAATSFAEVQDKSDVDSQAAKIKLAEILNLMPQPSDQTKTWWRDGFAGIIDNAKWRRMTLTGNYWFVFDAETVGIPRLGPASTPLNEIKGADLKLKIEVDGKSYVCKKGAKWSKFSGPRLIESGRFLQRTDIRGLEFESADGTTLNAEARFETAAWPDRLGLSLAVRPGTLPYKIAEESGGRIAGGFGLSGKNRFDIAAKDCQTPNTFTLSFWTFLSTDLKASRHSPWLVCNNGNEYVAGNYGIMLDNEGIPSAMLNVDGGKSNSIRFKAPRHTALKFGQWNHLALSYDDAVFRLVVNGRTAVEEKIGKQRSAPSGGLAFGARQDGFKGFSFRGVIDEIFLFDRALKPNELNLLHRAAAKNHDAQLKPIYKQEFKTKLSPMTELPRESWKNANLQVSIANEMGALESTWSSASANQVAWDSGKWEKASLLFDPVTMKKVGTTSSITVKAMDKNSNQAQEVTYDSSIGWHRINLDTVKPMISKGTLHPPNDLIERVRINLSNPSKQPKIARLMFEKTPVGFRQSAGQSITGISAMIRDADGNPTGIPVQLSKNWHTHPAGGTHSGLWFHGISQVRLPPEQSTELEFTIVYAHWGGVAAASHSQLSLIGYGGNHLWEQSAIGSWGESICYNPEQVFGECVVTDVRPLMVKPKDKEKKWDWTENVGGADFFRMFNKRGKRVVHTAVASNYQKTGPCLTDIQHRGRVGKTGIQHQIRSSISRTDDIVRATYRIRMDVTEPIEFSRFVIFQAGSDKYAYTEEKKIAVGDTLGVTKEWPTQRGGNAYRGKPIQCIQPNSWASLHATLGEPKKATGGWATRGVIIRKWNAKLGGKVAAAWIAERGTNVGRRKVSTIDIVPPPGLERFEQGDFVEATIEFVVIPQYAAEYYGPNESLRTALTNDQDTWKMVHREAAKGQLIVDVRAGNLKSTYPGVTISTENDSADFNLIGGVGYVPITFDNLSSHKGYVLTVDGKRIDQTLHGNDFWQTDYDVKTKRWSQTFNVPANDAKPINIQFKRQ